MKIFLVMSVLLSTSPVLADDLVTLQGGQSIRLILEGGRAAQVSCIASDSQSKYRCSLKFVHNPNCIMGTCHYYCVVYTESQKVVECVDSDESGSDTYRQKARERLHLLRDDGICQ